MLRPPVSQLPLVSRTPYVCSGCPHNDIVGPYLYSLATAEQNQRWLPGVCRGETILAIAMCEPNAGSDLQGITTTAIRHGDHYVLNGTKTFISSGLLADLIIVVARTDRAAGARGISLLVVEREMDGFERGRKLDKIGLKAMDTAELYFRDVRVPVTNLLGTEGRGFGYLMANLPQERLNIAVSAAAATEAAYETTLQYSKDRTAFGQPIGRSSTASSRWPRSAPRCRLREYSSTGASSWPARRALRTAATRRPGSCGWARSSAAAAPAGRESHCPPHLGSAIRTVRGAASRARTAGCAHRMLIVEPACPISCQRGFLEHSQAAHGGADHDGWGESPAAEARDETYGSAQRTPRA